MPTLGKAYVQIVPSAKGISDEISKVLGEEGSKGGNKAGDGFGKKFLSTAKKLMAGAAIGSLFKSAIDEAAKIQQSFGGLDTLYGDAAEQAKIYAKEAAKAGISANTYAEQAVSFGAALKRAFDGDTVKAAEAANTAIMDMADNSAKFGTDIESVQAAYQGFAKGQYQLLDNLALGYSGTKSGMESLLQEANRINAQNGKITNYSIDNLGDVYEAIHVVQEELGVAGVAAQEASTTFSGSMGAMKASWSNLLADIALGNDISTSLQTLADSVGTFLFGNLLPLVQNILQQVPGLIAGVFTMIGQYSDEIVSTAIDLVMMLVDGLITGIPILVNSAGQLWTSLTTAISSYDWMAIGTELLTTIGGGISAMGGWLWQQVTTLFGIAVNKIRGINWNALGRQVLTFVINGISSLGNSLWNLVTRLFQSALELIKGINWYQLGYDILTFVLNGLKNIGSTLGSTMKSLFDAGMSAVRNINWLQLGRDVINGIVRGLSNAGNAIKNMLMDLAKGALDAVKNFFKIGSPSRLMADEVGQWIPLGIAEGIQDNAKALTNSMEQLSKEAVASIDGNELALNAIAGSSDINAHTTIDDVNDMNRILYRIDAMIDLMAEYYPEMAKAKSGNDIGKINRALGLELI